VVIAAAEQKMADGLWRNARSSLISRGSPFTMVPVSALWSFSRAVLYVASGAATRNLILVNLRSLPLTTGALAVFDVLRFVQMEQFG